MSDLAQAISYVTNELAKVNHLTLLRDVLLIVQDADNRVKEAQKLVSEATTHLGKLKTEAKKVETDHAKKLKDYDAELKKRCVSADERFHAEEIAAAQRLARINEAFDEKKRFHDAMSQDCEVLSRQLKDLLREKTDLESDVVLIRKQLLDIKESIR